MTEFVNQLKGELESTFKEEISVYFDINPHDGLLETHDVDASLKDKLKCLVFIPIISRTYCDPKSFAWEHEFKVFIEQASKDQFGLKIKLPNGNVARRVLPVRIYDLDSTDIKLCESVLGGVLRSVDFIYKSAGVNRPLRANEDHPQDNLNKTYNRDQINKIANSIKEIITALGQNEQKPEILQKEIPKPVSIPRKSNKTKIISGSLILFALIVLGYFFIPKLFKPPEQLDKSIAVLPFINDSPDEENTYFINGIMEEVLNNLQKINEFRVLSRTSTDQYKGPDRPTIPEIAKKLDVNYVVEGSGQKFGNKFVLRVQLITGKNERHLWAESYNREIQQTTDIISVQSEIAQSIAAELKATITPEEKQLIEKTPTTNLTAYDFYQIGREELTKYQSDNSNKAALQKADDLFHKALKYDSTFAQAYSSLAYVYWGKHSSANEYYSENYVDSALILCNIALRFDNRLAEAYTVRGRYYTYKGIINKAIDDFDKALKINPNSCEVYYEKGLIYNNDDFVNSIDNYQKAASLNHGSILPNIKRVISIEYGRA